MNAPGTLTILAMLLVGLLLSAFFSGSETGFYRIARLRLALDARGGDPVAQGLLWLTGRPPMFVATALIGNNLANYLTSLAILLATRATLGGHVVAEFIVPILAAPFVFVYGELLPKNLFFRAPNKLLHRAGPLFLVFFVLFWPLSVLLSGLSRLLQMILGQSPEAIRLRLAREEIHQLLDEGKEVGLLRPAQRRLAQAVSDISQQPIMRSTTPMYRLPTVFDSDSAERVQQVARRAQADSLLVTGRKSRTILGYVAVPDLFEAGAAWNEFVRPLTQVRYTETHLATLMQLQTRGDSLAEVVDMHGHSVGIVSAAKLKEPILRS